MEERGRRFRRRRRFFSTEKPVKEGDVVKVKIEGRGKNGDGVARYENFVIFVKGEVEEGKEYDVKVVEVKHSFAVGEVVS